MSRPDVSVVLGCFLLLVTLENGSNRRDGETVTTTEDPWERKVAFTKQGMAQDNLNTGDETTLEVGRGGKERRKDSAWVERSQPGHWRRWSHLGVHSFLS